MRKNLLSLSVVGGSLLFGLSMLFTSCEGTLDDVFGHWDKPTPPECTVTSISLNETSLELFVEGGEKTATLTATLVGDPGNEEVEFSSGDDTRATVDPTTGEVTAVGGGEVTISANIGPTLQAQCKVMVYDKLHDISTDGAANIPDGKLWMITGTGSDKITIGEGSSAYLKDVSITTTTGSCIETAGMGYIYLVDGTTNTMNGAANFAAVNTAGGPLNILGQTAGTGKLSATGGTGGAGIGGSLDGNYSSIVIMGGEIEATGGDGAAGIGSGHCKTSTVDLTGGDITISGGIVTATGKAGGAGIGTGYGQTSKVLCGIITIEKKVVSVTATKGTGATNSIGEGSGYLAHQSIIFDTKTMFDGTSWLIPPINGDTYGGLKLAISTTTNANDTWKLTPAP